MGGVHGIQREQAAQIHRPKGAPSGADKTAGQTQSPQSRGREQEQEGQPGFSTGTKDEKITETASHTTVFQDEGGTSGRSTFILREVNLLIHSFKIFQVNTVAGRGVGSKICYTLPALRKGHSNMGRP